VTLLFVTEKRVPCGRVQTGTSIVIRGKGSVKEGRIGTKDGKPLPGADEPLHAYITSDIDENVKKGADRVLTVDVMLRSMKIASVYIVLYL